MAVDQAQTREHLNSQAESTCIAGLKYILKTRLGGGIFNGNRGCLWDTLFAFAAKKSLCLLKFLKADCTLRINITLASNTGFGVILNE